MLIGAIGGWIVGILVVAALIALMVVGVKQHLARTAAINAALSALPDFTVSQQYVGCDAQTAFAVDEPSGRFCLVTAGEPAVARVFRNDDLLEVELVEDNIILAKAARASRLRGVVMGGTDPSATPLQSPAELPAARRGTTPVPPGKVREIVLRFTVNDTQQPLHAVKFMNRETERTDSTYVRIMNEARGWHLWFTGVMERAELDASPPHVNRDLSSTLSVADELQKLLQLYQDGALSEAEFADQKAILLGRSSARRD